MPSINEVCDAVAGSIASISGLRALGYSDTDISPPQAHVYTRDFDPRFVFGDVPRPLPMGARVFVKMSSARAAQRALREFMEPEGSTSVLAKIEDYENWPQVDGETITVDYTEVTGIGQPFEYVDENNQSYMAVDFEFDALW